MDSATATAFASASSGGDRSAPDPAAAQAELLAIVKERSFRTGTFTLSSGQTSTLYFNMKRTMLHARGAALSAGAFLRLMRELGIDVVSGLEMGAVPVIGSMAALSAEAGSPIVATFARKRAKDHGTREVIEGLMPGESIAGRAVLVIDDVSTSGASILQAAREIRAVGGVVAHAACIVDRDEGGNQLLAGEGITLHHVLHVSQFLG